MATKLEVLNSFQPTQSYIGSHIRSSINSIDGKHDGFSPSKFKKGDCYTSYNGTKKRPCVIVKVLKTHVIGIPLTSDDNIHASIPFNCRFKGKGYFTNTIDIAENIYVRNNFAGIFEDKKAIKLAIESVKQIVNSIR